MSEPAAMPPISAPPARPASPWSWRVCRLAGVEVSIHATSVILILWLFFSIGAAAVLITLLALGCVLLHELGHALAARRFGIATRGIVLLPFGGVARLEQIPEQPLTELAIAAAGPAVNLFLAIVGAGLFAIWNDLPKLWMAPSTLEELVGYGGVAKLLRQGVLINVVMLALNLVPAFPLDGGRILRALLALKLDYLRATRWAARLGIGMALAYFSVFALGILPNAPPMLALIAVFVALGAAAEVQMVERRQHCRGLSAGEAMLEQFESVAPTDPLWKAKDLFLRSPQTDLPVARNGELLGVLRRVDLLRALARRGEAAAVGDVTFHEPISVDSAEPLERVWEKLAAAPVECMPVLRDGKLAGVLTQESLQRLTQVREALRQSELRT